MAFVIYAVKHGATAFGGVQNQTFKSNIDIFDEVSDGSAYPTVTAITRVRPEITYTSTNIASLLTNNRIKGELIDDSNSLTIYGNKTVQGGTRASAGHKSFMSTAGITTLESLSWQQNGNATVNVKASLWLPENGTAPYTVTTGATLPTYTHGGLYGLTGFTFNGAAMTGVTGVTINMAPSIEYIYSDGGYYPNHAYISEYKNAITINGVFGDWLGNLVDGSINSATFTFSKRNSDASYSDDDDIVINAYGLLTPEDTFSGSGSKTATCSLKLTCMYDGTNHPISIGA